MSEAEDILSEQESLRLIQQMIHKAKNSYHDTGIGPILWGSVISLCSLVTFFQIKYQFGLPFDIWLLTLIAIVPQVFIAVKEGRTSKVKGYDDRIMDTVWICFGISIFLLIFINANIVRELNPVFQTYIDVKGTKPQFNYSSFSTSFFLLLYGIPTIITGACRNMRPMFYGGIICWICCIISVFTKTDWDMILTAVAAMSAWLIPGIIIRSNFLKNSKANV
ncbi:hypothetical protein [Ferruginibacter profundus]